MELALGFLLGILASYLASALAVFAPPAHPRSLLAALRNPRLALRLTGNTEERRIRNTLVALTRAWETKNLDA